MPASPPQHRFRAEITALRAVAVLLVVLYHLWPGRLPGGYIGVDVFFVISGFLITGHLLRETAETGRVDLARFYARRARRLLPAAYLVLAVSAVAVWLWLPVMYWAENFKQIIASALYVQNWALAADSVDYLAADNAPTAVQHYWTLSIEEQFYLVWPLLIVLATVLAARSGRSRRLLVAVVLGAATLASLAYSLWITQANPPAAYFVTPARAWQFGAGALLALATTSTAARRTWTGPLSWTGFLALAWCGVTYDAQTPFPGTAAIVPVVATVAVIWAGEPAGRLSPARLMRWRPTTTLGDISYSMYLWHWPPIVILPFVLGHDLGLGPRVGILVGTIAVSWATKRWVEDPVRFTHRFSLRRPAVTGAFTVVGAALLVSASLAGHQSAVASERKAATVAADLVENAPRCFGAASHDPQEPCHNPALDDQLIPSPEAVASDYAQLPGCFGQPHDTNLNTDCTFGDDSDSSLPHVVLVGDSHARSFLPALVRMAEQGLITVTAQLRSSCAWARDEIDHDDAVRVSTCQEWKARLQTWLEDRADSTDLILTTGYAKQLGGDSDEEKVASMKAAWKPLTDRGVPIVAVRDNPRRATSPQECLSALDRITPDACALSRDDAFEYFDPYLVAGQQASGVQVMDLTDFYCDDATCPAIIGGVNAYRDNSHLSVTYVETMTPYVYRSLVGLGALPKPH